MLSPTTPAVKNVTNNKVSMSNIECLHPFEQNYA